MAKMYGKAAIESEEQQRLRWQIELEFVQCLANPNYLNFLAQRGYFKDPAFINYLKYLQYWKEPEYVKYLVYPTCLYFLDLLQHEEFRLAIASSHCCKFIDDQLILQWQHSNQKRVKLTDSFKKAFITEDDEIRKIVLHPGSTNNGTEFMNFTIKINNNGCVPGPSGFADYIPEAEGGGSSTSVGQQQTSNAPATPTLPNLSTSGSPSLTTTNPINSHNSKVIQASTSNLLNGNARNSSLSHIAALAHLKTQQQQQQQPPQIPLNGSNSNSNNNLNNPSNVQHSMNTTSSTPGAPTTAPNAGLLSSMSPACPVLKFSKF